MSLYYFENEQLIMHEQKEYNLYALYSTLTNWARYHGGEEIGYSNSPVLGGTITLLKDEAIKDINSVISAINHLY